MKTKMNIETGTPYSRTQLAKAFAQVQAPNWKDKISATIPIEDEDIIREAIIFYTGSVPWFRTMQRSVIDTRKYSIIQVRAEGYYEAVGA